MQQKSILTYVHDHKKMIIAVLVVALVVIITFTILFSKKNTTEQPDLAQLTVSPPIDTSEIPSPPVFNFPMYPTLAPALQGELEYPIIYKSITVEFKPKSGTFLVYSESEPDLAQSEAEEYIRSHGLNPAEYRIELRSFKDPNLPPMYEEFSENP